MSRTLLRRFAVTIAAQRWEIVEWLFLLVAWYVFVGRVWDGSHLPIGGEYARSMSPFFFWDSLKTCVDCSFWTPHGGGKPILADPFGSFLHPAAMVLSLLFGAVNGASYTLSFAFLLIGASGLWLGQQVGLHRLVRGWFALAVMLGGHIVCRLELGSIGMPLSIASLFAAFVVLYWYWQAPTLPRALILGVTVGALFTAGQMYYQYFFVLTIGILWLIARWRMPSVLERVPSSQLLLASGIAVLLVVPLVLNLVMTAGIYTKETDPDVKYAIPVHVQLLNFLLPTANVARTDKLNPFPYAWAYATYIGFLPVLAAFAWYPRIMPVHRNLARVVLGVTAFALVLATGVFSKIALSLGNETISYITGGFRFVVIYNGIAGIGILLLAALGTHGFMTGAMDQTSPFERAMGWLGDVLRVETRPIVIGLLSVYALIGMHTFAQGFITVQKPLDAAAVQIKNDIVGLQDGYVDMPDWLFLPAMQAGVRATVYASSVKLANRSFPPTQYMLTQKIPENTPTTILAEYPGDWKLVRNDAADQQYAVLRNGHIANQQCPSVAAGGVITVTCTSEYSGDLRVLVNAVPGWQVSLDGLPYQPVPEGVWLQAAVPAGDHTVTFRYAPWYAWVGLGLVPFAWLVILLAVVVIVRETGMRAVTHVITDTL